MASSAGVHVPKPMTTVSMPVMSDAAPIHATRTLRIGTAIAMG